MNKKNIIALIIVVLLLGVSAFFIFQFLFKDDKKTSDPPVATPSTEVSGDIDSNFDDDQVDFNDPDGTQEGNDDGNMENMDPIEGTGVLTLTTVDSYGVPTKGVVFQITNTETGESFTESVDDNGVLEKHLPYGEYTVEEVTPAEGYAPETGTFMAYLSDESPTFGFQHVNYTAEELAAVNPDDGASTDNPEDDREWHEYNGSDGSVDDGTSGEPAPEENNPYEPAPEENNPYEPQVDSNTIEPDYSSSEKTENPKTSDSSNILVIATTLLIVICGCLVIVYNTLKNRKFY